MATITTVSNPGITWTGVRDPATHELAIRIDASWMQKLKQQEMREWWTQLVDDVPGSPMEEATKLPIDFEDLAGFEEDAGPIVAPGPKSLQYVLIPRKPLRRVRSIPTIDLQRNAFAGWPDRLTALMMAWRRQKGLLFRDALFRAATSLYTYQVGGTQTLIASSGHLSDPTDEGSDTFGNLHTADDFTVANWEAAQVRKRARLGPAGLPLDMEANIVMGGSAMEPIFRRMFKRVLVLEDSTSNDAAAAVTNIHYGEAVIPIVSGWLDSHPWLLANAGKQQWWDISTTYPARPIGILSEGGPAVDVLDIGSEWEKLNKHILMIVRGAMNAGAGFPHVIDEHRGS